MKLKCLIAGFIHSGTTMLSELIRQHPEIDGRFEIGFLATPTWDEYKQTFYYTNLKKAWKITNEDFDYITASTLPDAYARLLERSEIQNKSVKIYDKLPDYLRNLDLVMKRVNVPCIVLVRDPRSIYWSHKKRWPKKVTLEGVANNYRKGIEGLDRALQLFSERILVVQYENFCTNIRLESKKVYDFLDLEFKDDYIDMDIEEINQNNVYGTISTKYMLDFRDKISKRDEKFLLTNTPDRCHWNRITFL
jgi:hypothetical protein